MKLGPRKYYKSIDYDLDTKGLQEYYPDYRTAYKALGKFMKQHGFIHRQYSVYNSVNKLSELDIIDLVDDLKHTFPWAATCINEFDVTNISNQHSMLTQLQTIEEEVNIDLDNIPDYTND